MVSSEFCEIFKNTFFTKHLWMTASVMSDYWYFFDQMFYILMAGRQNRWLIDFLNQMYPETNLFFDKFY